MNILDWTPPAGVQMLIAARVPHAFEMRICRGELPHTVLLYREQGLTPTEIRELVRAAIQRGQKHSVLFVTSSPILMNEFVKESYGYEDIHVLSPDNTVWSLLEEFSADYLAHFRLGDFYEHENLHRDGSA